MIGAFLDDWLSGWRGRTLLAVLLVALIAFPWMAGEDGRFYTLLLMTVFIFATLGHAWNLLAGYCGLLSFGLQVYVGLGGFTVGLLNFYGGAHVWLALPVAGVAAALFAWLLAVPVSDRFSGRRIWTPVAIAVVLWIVYELLVWSNPVWDVFGGDYVRRVSILLLIFLGALPLLRLQGAYFAVATWLIAAAVASIFGGWEVVGAGGGLNIPSDTTLAERYYVGLAILAASTLAVWWLLRSKYGLALTAVRDDEEAAMTVGVDVRRAKTLVFLISAPMVGLAGGLFYIDTVTITPPDAFHIRWSAFIVFVVVSGGMGSLAGPIVGAVVYVIVDRLVAGYLGTGELALGIVAVILILLLPRGLMGVIADLRARTRTGESVRPTVALFARGLARGTGGPTTPGLVHGGLAGGSGRPATAGFAQGGSVGEVSRGTSAPVFANRDRAASGPAAGPTARPATGSTSGLTSRPIPGPTPGSPLVPAGPPGVVSAFLVPGNPLPCLRPDNPPWQPLVAGFGQAREALDRARPDTLLVYSTQWIAVLDQLWQTRARCRGIHVDENWYEYGDLPYDLAIDIELAGRLVEGTRDMGITTKGVDYDGFPIDAGTIAAHAGLDPGKRYPLVIAANNLYHDYETTRRLGAMAAREAARMGRRVAVIGVGGLSGSTFTREIDIADDRIASQTDDEWNRRVLEMMVTGDAQAIQELAGNAAGAARVDMGFKHFAWLAGAMSERWSLGATVHAYGPIYGSGAAVVEFGLDLAGAGSGGAVGR